MFRCQFRTNNDVSVGRTEATGPFVHLSPFFDPSAGPCEFSLGLPLRTCLPLLNSLAQAVLCYLLVYLHYERVPVPSSWKPVSRTSLHDMFSCVREKAGVTRGLFDFQRQLSPGPGLMSSPVSLPTKEATRHKN